MVIASYRKAVAGDGVKTIHLKGSVDTASRGQIAQAVEIDIELPDRLAQRATIGSAEIMQVIDRDHGWVEVLLGIGSPLPKNSNNLDCVYCCPSGYRSI